MTHSVIRFLLLLTLASSPATHRLLAQDSADDRLKPYTDVLTIFGEDPLKFVLDRLNDCDLLIFDDAWHQAVEPFEFYQKLIQSPSFSELAGYVFVEVFAINKQKHIDAYLTAEPEDQTLLYPAFQDDFSGSGWPLKTYFDLMHAVYTANQDLPKDRRLKVVAVNAPTYWKEVTAAEDVTLFRKSLVGNDYTMYKTILSELDHFESGKKGVFLTNTRHAYKGIKKTSGEYFWNCGTFFHQWHPGKTFSIRFHNMALFIEKENAVDTAVAATTAGMENITYKWVRMGNGIWDSAFAAMGNKPVAFPLAGNVFGMEGYVGNHMHKAMPDQTMFDANDAIVFLAPLDELHNSAKVGFIYTKGFKDELVRRYRVLFTNDQLEKMYASEGVISLPDLVEKIVASKPEELIPQAKSLPSIAAWAIDYMPSGRRMTLETKQVVFHSPGPNWKSGVGFRDQPGVMDHVQHYASLLEQGKLLLGGPFTDDSGGMMIGVGTMTREELEEFADADPAVGSGLLTFVVKTWYVAMKK